MKEFPALHEEIDRPGVFFLVVGHVADGGAGQRGLQKFGQCVKW